MYVRKAVDMLKCEHQRASIEADVGKGKLHPLQKRVQLTSRYVLQDHVAVPCVLEGSQELYDEWVADGRESSLFAVNVLN
mmetsp:Transcript_10458/g.29481  ORF Transcript_10458/g.29481 Transcript_10458/m.29481 type:complete len:80 (+) Transcript_10458:329-568(+)